MANSNGAPQMKKEARFDTLRFACFGLGLIPKLTSRKQSFVCRTPEDEKKFKQYIDFLKAFGFQEEVGENKNIVRLRYAHGNNVLTIDYHLKNHHGVKQIALLGTYWNWDSFKN
jgi:hypothetical protein